MSNKNLPAKQNNFFDRLKRAFSVLRGTDSTTDLANWSMRLNEQEAKLGAKAEELDEIRRKLDAKAAALDAKAGELDELKRVLDARTGESEKERREIDSITRLYAGENRISPEIPIVQVNATKLVSSRFENLKQRVSELEEKSKMIKNVAMTEEEKDDVLRQYDELKGRLLGELAVTMEILTQNDISTTIIGDKNATLGIVAKSLPKALGIVGPEQGTGRTVFKIADPWRISKGAFEAYEEGLLDLHNIGFLQARDPRLDTHNLPDFDLGRDGDEGNWTFASFLNNYFGVDFDLVKGNDIFNRYHPLRNYKKPEGMQEMNISNNPVVGQVTEQIVNLGDRNSNDGSER